MSEVYKAFMENEAAIRRVFRRTFRRPDLIEELAQETFLRAFAAEARSEIREPKAFLFRIAKNLAISELRKMASSTDSDASLEDLERKGDFLIEGAPSAEDQVDGRRKLTALACAIASLPFEYRQVFLMRKLERLKYKQIATRLKVSVSLVEKRVAMAMVLCHDYLRKQGHDPVDFGAEVGKRSVIDDQSLGKIDATFKSLHK